MNGSALISVLLGLLGLILPMPIVFVVFGLAFSPNAIVKERKLKPPRPSQIYLAIAGCSLCGLSIALFFVMRSLPSR